MFNHRRSRVSPGRIVLLTMTLLLGSIFLAPPAVAAPPTNDDIANAVVVSTVPFTDTQDLTDATRAADDTDCGGGPTVWYSFTPSAGGNYQLDTFGSDFDTTLAVLSGTPGSLEELACNDDSSDNAQSAVRVDLEAGTTYYVEAGTCCGTPGTLVFNVSEAPPPVEVSVDITSIVTGEPGYATVTGTVTCVGSASYVEVGGLIRQRQGLALANADFYADLYPEACSDETVEWTATAWSDRVLLPRTATVQAYVYGCDDYGCDYEEVTETIRIRRR